MNRKFRVTVVDHQPLFVSGLELLLPRVSGGRATVVATTRDAASAPAVVRRSVPDLVLVELRLPPPGGVRVISAVRRTTPRVRVVAMSGDNDPAGAVAALRAGAEAFLPKTTEPSDLLQPLLAVLDGWAVVPPGLLGRLVAPGARPVPPDLDHTERQLLRLIAAGASTTAIGLELHVSERTVKRLTAALLRKLRVTSRTQAAAFAGSAGMI